jgi:hypothetical protein
MAELRFEFFQNIGVKIGSLEVKQHGYDKRRPTWSINFHVGNPDPQIWAYADVQGWFQIIVDIKQLRLFRRLIDEELKKAEAKEKAKP